MSAIELDVTWSGPAVPLQINTVIGGQVVLMGVTIRETTGTTSAQVLLLGQQSAGGVELVPFNLLAADSVRDWFGPGGLWFPSGLYPVITGAVAGALWVRLHHGAET